MIASTQGSRDLWFRIIIRYICENQVRHDLIYSSFESLHGDNIILFYFVETPRIIYSPKLSIRKPGSSSVEIKSKTCLQFTCPFMLKVS